MSFGRDFQIRCLADRKPREEHVVFWGIVQQEGGRKKIEVIMLECKWEGEMTDS